MRRLVMGITLLVVLGLASFYYFQIGVSPEVKRERHLKKAQEYMDRSQTNEAIIELKNALKADPGYAVAHHRLGMALLQKGDYRSAYSEFVRATDLQPNLLPARYQLGNLYVLSRDIPKAREQLTKIQENKKDSQEARY